MLRVKKITACVVITYITLIQNCTTDETTEHFGLNVISASNLLRFFVERFKFKCCSLYYDEKVH